MFQSLKSSGSGSLACMEMRGLSDFPRLKWNKGVKYRRNDTWWWSRERELFGRALLAKVQLFSPGSDPWICLETERDTVIEAKDKRLLAEELAHQEAEGLVEGEVLSEGGNRLVNVQFRRAAGVLYEFDAQDLPLTHGDRVVVETERGEELGWTVGSPQLREPAGDQAVKRVLRLADSTDLEKGRSNEDFEKEALRWAAAKVRADGLPMKMVAAQRAFSGSLLTFFFAADQRADFRNLVKDLAQRYRCRIEMRHISPRDAVKIVGAMGPCGRETCCSSWLRTFSPVTIQMAKDQGLSINPQKVAGMCGRLLCCLAFEQETYAELRRKLPRYGRRVDTPMGKGRVVDLYTLRERVRVELDDEGGFHEFAADEVSALSQRRPQSSAGASGENSQVSEGRRRPEQHEAGSASRQQEKLSSNPRNDSLKQEPEPDSDSQGGEKAGAAGKDGKTAEVSSEQRQSSKAAARGNQKPSLSSRPRQEAESAAGDSGESSASSKDLEAAVDARGREQHSRSKSPPEVAGTGEQAKTGPVEDGSSPSTSSPSSRSRKRRRRRKAKLGGNRGGGD